MFECEVIKQNLFFWKISQNLRIFALTHAICSKTLQFVLDITCALFDSNLINFCEKCMKTKSFWRSCQILTFWKYVGASFRFWWKICTLFYNPIMRLRKILTNQNPQKNISICDPTHQYSSQNHYYWKNSSNSVLWWKHYTI